MFLRAWILKVCNKLFELEPNLAVATDTKDEAQCQNLQKYSPPYIYWTFLNVFLHCRKSTRIFDPVSKKWTQSGRVIAIGERRSYDVQLGDGRIWTRNRKFLRPKVIRFEDELGDQGSSATQRGRDGRNDKAPATRWKSKRAK